METQSLDYQSRAADKKLAGRIITIVFWSIVGPAIVGGLIWLGMRLFAPGRVETARRGGPVLMPTEKVAINTFEVDNGRFPSTAEGWDALIRCPPGLEGTWVRQLDSAPVDQWGTPERYLGPTNAPDGEFEIISAGPDRVFGTADDIYAK